jgi:putative methyltransferase (TIGR04325 family)
VRTVLKWIIPPIIIAAVRRLRTKPNFRGPLGQEEVATLARSSAFDSDAWTQHTLKKIKEDPGHAKGFLTVHRFVIGTMISLLSYRRRSKVVDWGGGVGELFGAVMAQVERPEDVQYVVVDNNKLVSLGRGRKTPIQFVSIDESKSDMSIRNADILFLSSVLQYIQGWEEFLGFIAILAPRLVVVCRHISPDQSDDVIAAAQRIETRSGSACEVLILLVNWNKVVATMRQNGYRLVSNLVSDVPNIFGQKRDQAYGISERIMLFERVSG